jgi:hypothetical protein
MFSVSAAYQFTFIWNVILMPRKMLLARARSRVGRHECPSQYFDERHVCSGPLAMYDIFWVTGYMPHS